mmetsp:Transcript_17571/g.35288  ORF Transcript_17571/g.35288 Transcript_17571/m.35288 type:complete len:219 (+) Transcript_17571:388-1044(+)
MYAPPPGNIQATDPSMNYPNSIQNSLLSMYGIGGIGAGAPGTAAPGGGQQPDRVNQAAQEQGGQEVGDRNGQQVRPTGGAYPDVYDTTAAAATPSDGSNSNAATVKAGPNAAAMDGSGKKESGGVNGKASDTGSTSAPSDAVAAAQAATTATGASSNNSNNEASNSNNIKNDDSNNKQRQQADPKKERIAKAAAAAAAAAAEAQSKSAPSRPRRQLRG